MSMKRIFLSVFLVLTLSSTGCSLFGWYMNGDTFAPHNVDRDLWIKQNLNEAQRKEDWIACGGTAGGIVHISSLTNEGIHQIRDPQEWDKAYDAAQACMIKKGYHYIGSCRGEASRRLACKGKSIFNL